MSVSADYERGIDFLTLRIYLLICQLIGRLVKLLFLLLLQLSSVMLAFGPGDVEQPPPEPLQEGDEGAMVQGQEAVDLAVNQPPVQERFKVQ